ncbi:hypothetical protein D3OALGB2SA_559 [Olavius algarvensis associated proteobacterium Delta 3]|nr:hypothetical protein D3OALGB2SA_559 [Olavius algarvensis associated proteobacterium Delta 3]
MNIDAKVTAKGGIWSFTFLILFPSVHMPLFSFLVGLDVILIIRHDITS